MANRKRRPTQKGGRGTNQHQVKPGTKTSAEVLANDGGLGGAAPSGDAFGDQPKRSVTGRVKGLDLSRKDLREVDFVEGSVVDRGNFDGSVAEGVRFDSSCTNSSFRQLQGGDADFSRGTHIKSEFDEAELVGAALPDNDSGSFRGVDARGAVMRQRAYDDTDWSHARVHGAFIYHCGFYGADLSLIEGLAEADTVHNFYDEHTRFPEGYDPELHGWIRESRPSRILQGRERMLEAVREGVYDPLHNYLD